MITLQNVSYAYEAEQNAVVIKDMNVHIDQGQYVAIAGANGSGKSTLARLMNGLLVPQQGTVHIDSFTTEQEEDRFQIRQKVGMIFQNPENQMVATNVVDDVAFGAENLGVSPLEIKKRVEEALQTVHMWDEREQDIHHLSGGQKQRVAIAGILAMKPQVMIFDESTSMLDPQGKQEMVQLMKELHEGGYTIIHITHDMDLALEAERMILISKGTIIADDHPFTVFNHLSSFTAQQMKPPFVVEIQHELQCQGISLPPHIDSEEKLVEALWTLLSET